MLEIIKFPNPILRERMPDFDFENPIMDPIQLEKDMIETMLSNNGIGLAANQVGVKTRMFVMGQGDTAVGIFNPFVEEAGIPMEDDEGCLSFPKQGIHTKRYKNIIVKSADTESSYYFSGVESSQEGKGSWEDDNKQQDQEQRLLEAICVQHELDHLMGMTIHDREDKPKPIVSKKTFGRNEKVEITDGKILSTMKYKKAKPLIDSGLWTIYIGGPIT